MVSFLNRKIARFLKIKAFRFMQLRNSNGRSKRLVKRKICFLVKRIVIIVLVKISEF